MLHWLEVITESRQIEEIFGKDLPSLTSIDLHELIIHRDGPRAVLRFDLSSYPSPAPKKWERQGYNRVQLRLMLVGLSNIRVDGWSTNCVVDLNLVRDGDMVKLATSSGPTEIEIVASAAVIESVTAYKNI